MTDASILEEELKLNDYKKLEEFNKNLEDSISKLLTALSDDDFESVSNLITEDAKAKYKNEYKDNKQYIEKQKKLLDHINELKKVKSTAKYTANIIEEFVNVKEVFKEENGFPIYFPEMCSISIYYPMKKIARRLDFDEKLPQGECSQTIIGNNMLFICGGEFNHEFSDKCYLYTHIDNNFVLKNNMLEHRTSHAAVNKKDNEIFVVGGINSTGTLSSAEVYDINLNIWEPIPNISKPKMNCGLCIVSDIFLYLIGGSNTIEYSEIEVLNLKERTAWEMKVIDGAVPIVKPASIQIDENQILIFGGEMNSNPINPCLLYDFTSGEAFIRKQCPICDTFIGVRKINEMVYGIGMNSNNTVIYNLSEYDWKIIEYSKYTIKSS